jgi:hypothetical protein
VALEHDKTLARIDLWGGAAGLSFSTNISAFLKQCIGGLYVELRRRNAHVSGEGAGGGDPRAGDFSA